ncbi:hypothetical protein ABQE62_05990 [Mycolicibacterium fortuitum]
MNDNYVEMDDTKTAPAGHAKRRRAVIATASALAVLGVTVGGYALHHAGVKQGREQVSAATPVTAPLPDPTIAGTDTMCGGRYVITAGGKRYLLVDGGRATLIDIDANQRDEPCATGAADAAHTAQNLVGWDRDTRGCVRLAVIDGRQWIISTGWGLIPAKGRVAGTDRSGDAESERDGDKCSPAIRFGEKNADGTTPADPAPPVVPPIEDTAGYLIDSAVKCPSTDNRWQQFRFVPALGACIPFSTDGTGFKVRGDLAGGVR